MSADNVTIHAETFLKSLVCNVVGKRKKALGAEVDPLRIVLVGDTLSGMMIELVGDILLNNGRPASTETRL